MTRSSMFCFAAAAVLALGALAGCDERLAMQPARDHGSAELASASAPAAAVSERTLDRAPASERAPRPERVSAPVPLVAGKPMWSDNRTHTAEENALYQFQHHGDELGARTLDDFVAKAHRFTDARADGMLTLTRANGDTLMFDPRSKLFGVVRKDGAPRTVFKPETGKAYWDEQVTREKSGAGRTASNSPRRDRDDDRS